MISLCILASLCSGATPSAQPMPGPDPVPIVTTVSLPVDAYDDLLAEYQEALAAFQEELDEIDSLEKRRKLQKKAPVHKFWRKFEKVAKADPRGLVWLLDHVEAKEADAKKRTKMRDKLSKQVLKADVTSEGYGDLLRLMKDLELPEADLLAIYENVIETSPHAAVQAQALYRKAWLFQRSSAKDRKDQHGDLLRACAERFPGTRYGTMAHAAVITDADLEVGKSAPDFYAETIDGHAFKLSDYRGKVVLLDFYGFW